MWRRRKEGAGQACVSADLGFPPSRSKVAGAPSHLYPFCVKITSRKVPLPNAGAGLRRPWNGDASAEILWGLSPDLGCGVTHTDGLA